jgi:hypothetical protein
MCSVPRSYKEENWGDQVKFCMRVCEQRACACEAEESPLFKSVTKKLPVKILQAEEDLACSDL